ncbi:unnamed protein product [Cuscuta campestris]|uniref:Uncharacterized protein n=1 Tax=Cuscuta campestris TaxID=132261 RepID=A0A484MS33_9ASTE|nr:unnamed protein product [Cuscuta campestris]
MDMMLGSFGSSSSSSSRSHDHFDVVNTNHLRPLPHHRTTTDDGVAAGLQYGRLSAPPATQLRQLLLTCAELVSRSDLSAARRLLSFLSANASPLGDSAERLAHQFVRALSHRLHRHVIPLPPPDPAALQSSYLCLNQVTPFLRFIHLTANQAILEAVDRGQRRAVHVVDFDIMHGVQWPPLMQALADRYPPPALRITGTGRDLETLRRTGDRLAKFAHSLGMRFQFHPVLAADDGGGDHPPPPSVVLLPDETLAVNCTLYLHRLLRGGDRLRHFLRRIKEMRPKVVTVAEREASHNHPLFMRRFAEAVDHYAAVFDSLEATLPPSSRERAAVEQVWFGGEISDIVAAEGEKRGERFGWWEEVMRGSGFRNVGLSPFALSQAKLLLRLHYPSEGYQLRVMPPDSSCFLLGWQNQPLFSVSSWH